MSGQLPCLFFGLNIIPIPALSWRGTEASPVKKIWRSDIRVNRYLAAVLGDSDA